MTLDTYLKRLERGLRHMPRRDRQSVLTEIRAHLRQRAADNEAQGMPRDVAMEEALLAFGPAEEVAIQYAGGAAYVTSRSGALEVALRTGRAAGRGIAKAVLYAFWTVAIVAAAALVAVLVVLVAYEDVVRDGVNEVLDTRHRELVDRDDAWDDHRTQRLEDRFEIMYPVRDSAVRIHVEPSAAVGCAQVTVSGPGVQTIFDSGLRCDETIDYRFEPVREGEYTLTYQFTAWAGSLEVEGYALERLPEN